MTARNKRWLYVILIFIDVPLGLATRWRQQYFTPLITEYGGDVLAATCIFFGLRFLLVKWPLLKVAYTSYFICVLIEIQQLYQASWAVKFRNITVVGILLGHGFLWSDIVCYAAGIIIGLLISIVLERMFAKPAIQAAC